MALAGDVAGGLRLDLHPAAAGAAALGGELPARGVSVRRAALHGDRDVAPAWDVPYNGLSTQMVALWGNIGSFPAYPLAVFVLPLLYGAWRFTLFHALMGPIAASMLTDNPNEVPAIWCLFSIGILLATLSPQVWRVFSGEPAAA